MPSLITVGIDNHEFLIVMLWMYVSVRVHDCDRGTPVFAPLSYTTKTYPVPFLMKREWQGEKRSLIYL